MASVYQMTIEGDSKNEEPKAGLIFSGGNENERIRKKDSRGN
mgnify:CR=1 FL=1